MFPPVPRLGLLSGKALLRGLLQLPPPPVASALLKQVGSPSLQISSGCSVEMLGEANSKERREKTPEMRSFKIG